LFKIVIEAARKAELADSRITMDLLEGSIDETKPSVTLKELLKYEELKERWDLERNGNDTGQRKIGFVALE
jgi:hypothetical protein